MELLTFRDAAHRDELAATFVLVRRATKSRSAPFFVVYDPGSTWSQVSGPSVLRKWALQTPPDPEGSNGSTQLAVTQPSRRIGHPAPKVRMRAKSGFHRGISFGVFGIGSQVAPADFQ